MKFKIIRQKGRVFLIRLSFPLKKNSLKLHLILNDDLGIPHKHPWRYKSFLLIGAYKEWLDGIHYKHRMFSIIKRNPNQRHRVILYKLKKINIPCLTVGVYSKKIQPWCENTNLCDNCIPLGLCMDKKYWESF